MYKRSANFHNSDAFGRRQASYGRVVHRDAEKVNAELTRSREARSRGPVAVHSDLTAGRSSLIELLRRLAGDRLPSEFLCKLPSAELNSLATLLHDLELYRDANALAAIRRKIASNRTVVLSKGERTSALRVIAPIVEDLIRDPASKPLTGVRHL